MFTDRRSIEARPMRNRLIFQCDCFARFAVVHRHLADDYESSSHRKAEVRNRELRTGSRTPPVFADSLPDAFGRGLVDRWLTEKGCVRSEITALDRLAYCDTRGEGGAGFKRINNEEPRFCYNTTYEKGSDCIGGGAGGGTVAGGGGFGGLHA